ncbi:MAG: trigger factor [Anaerolineales bacterium]|nr:trigger factor [Chloroflexota bacterium]MBL6983432.1 trigger factor [Anaerolineales bacterium]
MKIEQEILEDRQVKLNVEIDDEPWQKAKHQAARRLAKRVKIPGFRPGKAPYPVIVRNIGEGPIVEEALEILIDDVYPKVLDEAEIEPYGPGRLEEVEELDPPKLEFVIPLQPEVEVGDYKAIEIEYEAPVVEDAEVDEALENMRQQQAVNEPVERAAEDGDIVYMRVSGKRLDVKDEEEAMLYDQQFSSARLGQEDSATDRQFFEGFSEEIVGLAPEEQKSFNHTYPDDYEDEELQGVEVEFTVDVTNVQAYSLPKLDDEFAKSSSEFDTIEEMREDIKTRLQEQAELTYADEYENQVVDKLIAESTLSYPPQMVENEKKDILANLDFRLSQQGLNKDIYMQFRGVSEEEFEEEIDETAEQNVKRTMVLYEVANAEEIKPDSDKFNETTESALGSVTANMTPQQIKDMQKGGQMANLITNIAADLTLRQTIEYLVAIAKGEPLPEPKPATDGDAESEVEADTEDKAEAEAGEETPEAEANIEEKEPTEPTEEDSPAEEIEPESKANESEEA